LAGNRFTQINLQRETGKSNQYNHTVEESMKSLAVSLIYCLSFISIALGQIRKPISAPDSIISSESLEQKIKNLEAFAKVYGYVKYFHPGDETTRVDWMKFSAYGAKVVENCRSNQQLADSLLKLFSPMAPSVRFVLSKGKPAFATKEIIPPKSSTYNLTWWQHFGVGTGTTSKYYKSIRMNREETSVFSKAYYSELWASFLERLAGQNDYHGIEYQPKVEDVICSEIAEDLYCQVPVVLFFNSGSTYPNANLLQFKNLVTKVELFHLPTEKLALRLGNVINVYNVFQHFYPYFDVVNVNWNEEFSKALRRCYRDSTSKDHLITLEKFTAPLKDGHIHFQPGFYYTHLFSWEWVEGKLILTNLSDTEKRFKIGDVVTKINGINAEKYFEEIKSRISAGTDSYLNYMAERKSLLVDYNSKMKVEINGKTFELTRPGVYDIPESKPKNLYKQITADICYLNVIKLKAEDVNRLMPDLVKARAIICDARDYPDDGEPEFIKHLMKSDDTTRSWMQVPRIVYPDHKTILGYYYQNWMTMMKAKKPYLGDKKMIYIIDGSAISYAESCLGYIEGYKLATIVGQPSAGTNGDINMVRLLDGFSFTFTGLKVVKHNHTPHHGIGIRPDVYVNKTIKGIQEGRDEFLEKAIDVAKQKLAAGKVTKS
jgi:hypothetical protein